MPRRLLDRVVRRVPLPDDPQARGEVLLGTEWIVTNGLGGYASSTLAGVTTRRYHGILVAALENPLGRTVLFSHLDEYLDDQAETFGRSVAEVRLEAGLPVWEYQVGDVRIEKRVVMPHKQNTVHITYRIMEGPERVTVRLEPSFHFRGYEDPVNDPRFAPGAARYTLVPVNESYVVSASEDFPVVWLHVSGGTHRFVDDARTRTEVLFPVEQDRGYQFKGALWTPGRFEIDIAREECATLIASAERQEIMLALTPEEVAAYEHERRRRLVDAALPQCQDETGAELVLAADQFIITPKGRIVDATRAAAMGNEVRTVIAGYHWFTDWGRDTMISLEGLTLMTGRPREASFILRTFAHYVRDGLIPNMFPDGSNQGLYHTADATLWFFHAVEAYVRRTGDRTTLIHILPTMLDIFAEPLAGTRFGIGVDPADGLLRQGAEGYQLTWMDAKVDGWVVTPRRGKAVEINALWYNALKLLEGWLTEVRGEGAGDEMRERAETVRRSFNERFWNAERGFLYDVVDGDPEEEPLCRPNQIFAISLDHPVLERDCWEQVIAAVHDRLLTPVGLRSLAPGEKGYKARYFGDLRARDAAYHQGTVWGWLIGPFIDAWLKVHPNDRAGARKLLTGCIDALGEFGLGTIGEIFDAEAPYAPRGCIAQAWSIAEVLRCWVKTAPEVQPAMITT
jgi:predicted glycogen debranching enzyme